MKVSILGLGYVGSVSAACFADLGHTVIGVDPNATKVDLLNAGKSPIVEKDLGEIIARVLGKGLLRATTNTEDAVLASDVSLICVGTPSNGNGSLNLHILEDVCAQLAEVLAKKQDFHVVIIRSTILPGTMRGLVIPTLERISGKRAGVDFGVCNNPEFLREGTAVFDFHNPPKTVIGQTDSRSGDLVQALYTELPGPMIRCPIEVGEMVKYADNAWHAVKIAFANEIGKFAKAGGIDSHAVMNIFCQDTKLNLSSYYMRPGFAFGGSCLPKDVRALNYKARNLDVSTPLLNSLLVSNQSQVEWGLEMIHSTNQKSVGILGFSFKSDTDDLRESPMVAVIEHLLGKGFELFLYDKNVNVAKLMGANREYILKVIPHIERLMLDSIEEVLARAKVIVIGNPEPEFASIARMLRPDQRVIDFVRIREVEQSHKNYDGICW